jgi:hypothetical protein
VSALCVPKYEGGSVNTSQMDIKRKIYYIPTCKNPLFFDIYSRNIDTLLPSLYQSHETRSVQVFSLLSQLLLHVVKHHLRLSKALERIFRPRCEPLYATDTSNCKQETFLYEYPLYWVLFPTKKPHNRTLLFSNDTQLRSPFWLLKPASEHAHARLLPRLSRSWTVLLPSDIHRKPITPITVALLPFVTYLLTLPTFVCMSLRHHWKVTRFCFQHTVEPESPYRWMHSPSLP